MRVDVPGDVHDAPFLETGIVHIAHGRVAAMTQRRSDIDNVKQDFIREMSIVDISASSSLQEPRAILLPASCLVPLTDVCVSCIFCRDRNDRH
jgi:hypothetical protein